LACRDPRARSRTRSLDTGRGPGAAPRSTVLGGDGTCPRYTRGPECQRSRLPRDDRLQRHGARPYPLMHAPARLPIDHVLPEIARALATHARVVLHAPPGAGKTTRVPIALLESVAGRIIMLEPRRLAARSAASWMSRMLGEDVGGTVGYRVRLDSRVGPRTRI